MDKTFTVEIWTHKDTVFYLDANGEDGRGTVAAYREYATEYDSITEAMDDLCECLADPGCPEWWRDIGGVKEVRAVAQIDTLV